MSEVFVGITRTVAVIVCAVSDARCEDGVGEQHVPIGCRWQRGRVSEHVC